MVAIGESRAGSQEGTLNLFSFLVPLIFVSAVSKPDDQEALALNNSNIELISDILKSMKSDQFDDKLFFKFLDTRHLSYSQKCIMTSVAQTRYISKLYVARYLSEELQLRELKRRLIGESCKTDYGKRAGHFELQLNSTLSIINNDQLNDIIIRNNGNLNSSPVHMYSGELYQFKSKLGSVYLTAWPNIHDDTHRSYNLIDLVYNINP